MTLNFNKAKFFKFVALNRLQFLALNVEITITCPDCTDEFSSDDLHTVNNGDSVCQDCLDSNYSFCEVSEDYFLNEDMVEAHRYNSRGNKESIFIQENAPGFVQTESGEFWAEDDTLSAYTRRNNSIIISREELNEGDYQTCDDCGEIFDRDYMTYMENLERDVCHGCESDYTYCSSCESYSGSDSGCGCDNEEEEEENTLIKSYNYKPSPIFHGKQSKLSPFTGCEIEIESKSKNSDALKCASFIPTEKLYLKEDSSIGSGFEMVSHPMTLVEHKKTDWKGLFESLISSGARSHDTSTCGLHFHLDKTNMADSHKVRFDAFFALNKSKMELIARRSSEKWAKFKAIDSTNFGKSNSRYEAVNWENENTVEIRIFKGTLKYETFMASMELCNAVYAFTHNRKSFECEFTGLETWKKFTVFLNKNRKKFPFLIDYLELKKLKIEALDVLAVIDENESESVA